MLTSTFAFHDTIQTGRAWEALSDTDKENFDRLRLMFQEQTKPITRDRKSQLFQKEIQSVLEYIESSPDARENRSIVTGLGFTGPFICVNTRQFKNLMGKCKSSINGCFQEIGYIAVKTKPKARAVILSVLPSLQGDPGAQRQWTVRYHPGNPIFSSVFETQGCPTMTEADLYEDKRVLSPPTCEVPLVLNQQKDPAKPAQVDEEKYDFRPPSPQPAPEMKASVSLDFLTGFGDDWDYYRDDMTSPVVTSSMVRSKSHMLSFSGFDDGYEWSFL